MAEHTARPAGRFSFLPSPPRFLALPRPLRCPAACTSPSRSSRHGVAGLDAIFSTIPPPHPCPPTFSPRFSPGESIFPATKTAATSSCRLRSIACNRTATVNGITARRPILQFDGNGLTTSFRPAGHFSGPREDCHVCLPRTVPTHRPVDAARN